MSKTRQSYSNSVIKVEKIIKDINQLVTAKNDIEYKDPKNTKGIEKYEDKILLSFYDFEENKNLLKVKENDLENFESLLHTLIESLLKSTVALTINGFKAVRKCFNLFGSLKLANYKKIDEFLQLFINQINKISIDIFGIENMYLSKNIDSKHDQGNLINNIII